MAALNRITLAFIALLLAAPVSAADAQKDLEMLFSTEGLECFLEPDPKSNSSAEYYSAECIEKRKPEDKRREASRKRKIIKLAVASIIAIVVIVIVFRKRRRIASAISSRWRRRSKAYRVWVFGSFSWAVGVLLYVLLVDPYGGRYMRDDDLFHMLSVMIIPPFFFGAVWFGYKRFVD